MSGGVVLMSQAEKVKEQRTAENQALSLRIHQVLFLPHFLHLCGRICARTIYRGLRN